MDKLHALEAERALAADKLTLIAEGPDDKFDVATVGDLEKSVKDLDVRIAAIKRGRSIQASLAQPVKGQPGTIPAMTGARSVLTPLSNIKGEERLTVPSRRPLLAGQHVRQRKGLWPGARKMASGQKALSEGVNCAGGYLVPEEMQNEIIVLRNPTAWRAATSRLCRWAAIRSPLPSWSAV
jgi:HK97 family phage major capsid protein